MHAGPRCTGGVSSWTRVGTWPTMGTPLRSGGAPRPRWTIPPRRRSGRPPRRATDALRVRHQPPDRASARARYSPARAAPSHRGDRMSPYTRRQVVRGVGPWGWGCAGKVRMVVVASGMLGANRRPRSLHPSPPPRYGPCSTRSSGTSHPTATGAGDGRGRRSRRPSRGSALYCSAEALLWLCAADGRDNAVAGHQ